MSNIKSREDVSDLMLAGLSDLTGIPIDQLAENIEIGDYASDIALWGPMWTGKTVATCEVLTIGHLIDQVWSRTQQKWSQDIYTSQIKEREALPLKERHWLSKEKEGIYPPLSQQTTS